MELLISMTILSVIVLLVMSALRISTNAWEKGEKNIESGQRLRAVMAMMVDQIGAIRTDKAHVKENEVYFKGDSHTLAFVTTSTSGYDGTVQSMFVTYSVKTEDSWSQLLLTERKIPILPPLTENTEVQTEENPIILLPTCYDVHFEYLKSLTDVEGLQWQETWNPIDETGVPLAVRIVLQEDEKVSPVRAIARIV